LDNPLIKTNEDNVITFVAVTSSSKMERIYNLDSRDSQKNKDKNLYMSIISN